ncbi:hypothetical protein ACQP2F_20715 [Actinoplanes sp. CA-030573]|uniref:hypothetical protein n=1 Tax=Actinoplanes sp. CA-030573 TaxID=3239898 RepID=UPI003D94DB32
MNLLPAAVRNNAEWCALVCRTHGVASRFGDRAWRAEGQPPPFYPSAITLTPDAAAADVLPASSVKDSYAALDLDGFTPLFEARWIHRPAPSRVPGPLARRVATPAELREWHAQWGSGDVFRPALLDDPAVAVLAVDSRGGAVLNRAAGVVGVSNVFAVVPADIDGVWSATVHAAAALFPGLDLVGYEHGDDLTTALAAGFAPIGPLRVLVSASPG